MTIIIIGVIFCCKCFNPLSPWIPQFKYSKTILERYHIASFNKTLSFQKLLHIDGKCHRQLIQSSESTAQTRLSMCCWQENNCVISCSEQEADRKKTAQNLCNHFLLWKRRLLNCQQLKVEHWKTNSYWGRILYYVAALGITRYWGFHWD